MKNARKQQQQQCAPLQDDEGAVARGSACRQPSRASTLTIITHSAARSSCSRQQDVVDPAVPHPATAGMPPPCANHARRATPESSADNVDSQ